MIDPNEIVSAFERAGVTPPVPVVKAAELAASNPVPEPLRGIHPDAVPAELAAALVAFKGDAVAAVRDVALRTSDTAGRMVHLLNWRRDVEAETMLRAASPELDATLTSALAEAGADMITAETAMTEAGLRHPRHTDGNSVRTEPVAALRAEASERGSAALAVFERWHAVYLRRQRLEGLTIRMIRIGLLTFASAANQALKAQPPAPLGRLDQAAANEVQPEPDGRSTRPFSGAVAAARRSNR